MDEQRRRSALVSRKQEKLQQEEITSALKRELEAPNNHLRLAAAHAAEHSLSEMSRISMSLESRYVGLICRTLAIRLMI